MTTDQTECRKAWHQDMDARRWAREWLETIAKNPDIPTDEGAMVAWFANAIMCGYDEAMRNTRTAPADMSLLAMLQDTKELIEGGMQRDALFSVQQAIAIVKAHMEQRK